MEQFLMNAFIFAFSAVTLVGAWIGISASRRSETLDAKIDAKIAQQAALKRMSQNAVSGVAMDSKQQQTI